MSCKLSKQTYITRSSIELEFIALDKVAKKILRKYSNVIKACAIGRIQNKIYNDKLRHIHQRNNTIRELLLNEIIFIDYIKSKDNITDPLTKINKKFN